MKRIKTIAFFLYATVFFVNAQKVSICTGDYSYAYHSHSNCRGLNNCQGKIIQVDVSTAEKVYNRKPCEICCVQGLYIEGITNNTLNNGLITYKPSASSSGYLGSDYSGDYSLLLLIGLPILGLASYTNCIFLYPAYNFNHKKDNNKIRWMFGIRKIFDRTALELGASYLVDFKEFVYIEEYYDESKGKMVKYYCNDPALDYKRNVWGFHLNYFCYFQPYSSRKSVNMYIGPTINYIEGIGFGGLTGVELKVTRWFKIDVRYEWTTRTNQIQTGLVFKYQ